LAVAATAAATTGERVAAEVEMRMRMKMKMKMKMKKRRRNALSKKAQMWFRKWRRCSLAPGRPAP